MPWLVLKLADTDLNFAHCFKIPITHISGCRTVTGLFAPEYHRSVVTDIQLKHPGNCTYTVFPLFVPAATGSGSGFPPYVFPMSQLEISIFKSDWSSQHLTSERMRWWKHTQKEANTPEARCQMLDGQMSQLTFFYQKPILSEAIITYQSLMLVTNAQGSSSLIALWFPVLSLPLQTPLCHGSYLTFCNESFLISIMSRHQG